MRSHRSWRRGNEAMALEGWPLRDSPRSSRVRGWATPGWGCRVLRRTAALPPEGGRGSGSQRRCRDETDSSRGRVSAGPGPAVPWEAAEGWELRPRHGGGGAVRCRATGREGWAGCAPRPKSLPRASRPDGRRPAETCFGDSSGGDPAEATAGAGVPAVLAGGPPPAGSRQCRRRRAGE